LYIIIIDTFKRLVEVMAVATVVCVADVPEGFAASNFRVNARKRGNYCPVWTNRYSERGILARWRFSEPWW
jgi:hypothetical protein